MADQWMVRGVEYGNCNCAYGCPCQFNQPPTYGNCRAMDATHIEEGHFGDVKLDGLTCSKIDGSCIRLRQVLESSGEGPEEIFAAFPEDWPGR